MLHRVGLWEFLAVLAIPPLITLVPALMGLRFRTVVLTAVIATAAAWGIAIFLSPNDSESGWTLIAAFLVALFALVHAALSALAAAIPWVVMSSRRRTPGSSGSPV